MPSEANLEKLISWIEEGRKRSFSENREACQADWDAEQRDISLKSDAIIRNALPSFGIAPMVGRGGGRGTKTRPILKTAQELGLPVGGNKFKAGQTGQRFQVPL
jgi:hypothetical protein